MTPKEIVEAMAKEIKSMPPAILMIGLSKFDQDFSIIRAANLMETSKVLNMSSFTICQFQHPDVKMVIFVPYHVYISPHPPTDKQYTKEIENFVSQGGNTVNKIIRSLHSNGFYIEIPQKQTQYKN